MRKTASQRRGPPTISWFRQRIDDSGGLSGFCVKLGFELGECLTEGCDGKGGIEALAVLDGDLAASGAKGPDGDGLLLGACRPPAFSRLRWRASSGGADFID